MPEEIMVDSWRVMTVSSAGLMRWKRLMSPLKAFFFSRSSMAFRPCPAAPPWRRPRRRP